MRALLVGPMVPAGVAGRRWFDAELRRASRAADVIVAVDGGLDHCARLRLAPDLAVGDWDSLRDRRLLERVPIVSHPVDKDRSDLYYALQELRRLGRPSSLVCIGFAGGRPDHHLAVLHELSLFGQKGVARGAESLVLHEFEADYYFLSRSIPELKLRTRKGQTISIFAIDSSVSGLTLEGFRFPLIRAKLEPSSRGLSNEARGAVCRVQVGRGRLLVVLPK